MIIVRGAKRAMIMPADFGGAAEAIAEAAKRAEIGKGLINDALTKFYKFRSQTFFETSPEEPVQEKVYGATKLTKLGKKPAKKGVKTKKGRHNK